MALRTHEHTQVEAADEWVINHGFGDQTPMVHVWDDQGEQVPANWYATRYESPDQLVIVLHCVNGCASHGMQRCWALGPHAGRAVVYSDDGEEDAT